MTPKVQYQKGVTQEINKSQEFSENIMLWVVYLVNGALAAGDYEDGLKRIRASMERELKAVRGGK
jgi:hypothetical protein